MAKGSSSKNSGGRVESTMSVQQAKNINAERKTSGNIGSGKATQVGGKGNGKKRGK